MVGVGGDSGLEWGFDLGCLGSHFSRTKRSWDMSAAPDRRSTVAGSVVAHRPVVETEADVERRALLYDVVR